MGVDAVVFNDVGELLLIQRKDNQTWAMPGGIAEIGDTLAETALKELWEEAGLRGEVKRLLGVFDGRFWGSRSPIHNLLAVFEVQCPKLEPAPGLETLGARFFRADALPELHNSHQQRVPLVFKLRQQATFFDPASSVGKEMSMFQRLGPPQSE